MVILKCFHFYLVRKPREEECWLCDPARLPVRPELVLVEPDGETLDQADREQDPRDLGDGGEGVLQHQRRDPVLVGRPGHSIVMRFKHIADFFVHYELEIGRGDSIATEDCQ